VGCKGKNPFLFNQIFLSLSPPKPLQLNTTYCRRTIALFERTAKIQPVFLPSKFFSKELPVC
jgi:hypothetical protein